MTEPRIEAHSACIDYPIIMTGAQQSLFAGLAHSLSAGRFARSASGMHYVTAVSGFNIKVGPGDRIGLIGRNGAGKSSLLKLFAGVLPPTRGEIEIVGSSTNILSLGSGMDADQTGYENIRRMSRLLGIPKSEWKAVQEDVEDFTELGKFLALPVRTYSSGMSLRLGFAMATAYPRDILVVDEVIGAGDMFFMEKAIARIQSYTSKIKILIMATHSFGALEAFCNRALFMEGGVLQADGDISGVWSAYAERGGV